MLFNTTTFAVFFVIVLGLYNLMRGSIRWQNVLLLLASYVFYGWWDARFLVLIVASTSVDYCCGLVMDGGRMRPRHALIAGGMLFAAGLVLLGVDWGAAAWTGTIGDIVATLPRAFSLESVWWTPPLVLLGGLVVVLALLLAAARMGGVAQRRVALTVSVVANLGMLGFFKYFDFFSGSFAGMWQSVTGNSPGSLVLDIVLPVGISFYTFQTMSYTIDIFRKKISATENYVDFATFVAFFPQLVAGPIERASHLLPQFERARRVTATDVREGGWLILWGLYKKIVVADNVASVVNPAFDSYSAGQGGGGAMSLLAVFAFAIQIYCDFSGYTDIARGTARLLGFDLRLNFRLPYIALSPSDFWQRWHISLSSWLRDYLYFPLGGNKCGTIATYRNLMLTMILGGLWHGAAWNFVAWGFYHGLLLVGYRLLGDTPDRVAARPLWQRLLLGLLMFSFTLYGWLLFRARDWTTIRDMSIDLVTRWPMTAEAGEALRSIVFYSWLLIAYQVWQGVSGNLMPHGKAHWFVRLTLYGILVYSIAALMPVGRQEFIYFAF